MAKTKESVTRLLAKRKALTDRIAKATGVPFVGVQKGTDTAKADVVSMSGKSVADASKLYQGNLDKVRALIKFHQNITEALVKSNATTTVTVGGVTRTVAATIELKTSIEMERKLVATAIRQLQLAETQITSANDELERRIDKQIETTLGSEKSKTATADARNSIAEPMEKAGKHVIIDPTNLAAWAQKRMDEIHTFETEVDFILSESNAVTMLEVDDGEPEATTATPAPAAQ